MVDAIALITEIFTSIRPDNNSKAIKDRLTGMFNQRDDNLLNDLQDKPDDADTQKKLKAFIAEISTDDLIRTELLEKLSSLNKTRSQAIINQQPIEKQINIQHHSGNIIINYASPGEKEADSATRLFDIKMLLSSGDTKQAIEKLLEVSKISYPDSMNNAILVAGRFNRLNKEMINGTVSSQDSGVELNKINGAVLYYLNEMEKKPR